MKTVSRWVITAAAVLLVGQGFYASVMDCAGAAEKDNDVEAVHRAGHAVHDGYRVEEIRYGAAMMREYITPTGVIFGLDWKGMIHPDVTDLLGSIAGTHPEGPADPGQAKKSKTDTEAEEVVIQKWGQPDDPHGRAYAPDLAPQGVKPDRMWLDWPAT